MTDPFARLLNDEMQPVRRVQQYGVDDPFTRLLDDTVANNPINPISQQYEQPSRRLFGEGDGFLPSLVNSAKELAPKVGKAALGFGKGLLESMDVVPELHGGESIPLRTRLARGFNLATLPVPLAGPFKVAKYASTAKKAAAAAGGTALLSGTSALIEGNAPIMERAAQGGILGAGLETGLSLLSKGKIRRAGAASKAAFNDAAKFSDPVNTPFKTDKEWAITSPMMTKPDRFLDSAANQAKYSKAIDDIDNVGLERTEARGYHPNKKNPDGSLLMHGVDDAQAVELAQKWGQDWTITPNGLIDLKTNEIRPIKDMRFDNAIKPTDEVLELLVDGNIRRVAFDFDAPIPVNPKLFGYNGSLVDYDPANKKEFDINKAVNSAIAKGLRYIKGLEKLEDVIEAKASGTLHLPSHIARQDATGVAESAAKYNGVPSFLDRNLFITNKSAHDIITQLKGNEKEAFDDYLVARRKLALDDEIKRLQQASLPRMGIPVPNIPNAVRYGLNPADRQVLEGIVNNAKTNTPHFGKVADELYDWRKAHNEWLYETNKLTRDEVDYLNTKLVDYVPLNETDEAALDSFQRIFDGLGYNPNHPSGPTQQLEMLNKSLNLKKVKDPSAGLIIESEHLANASRRAYVGSELVNWLESVGPDIAKMFAKRVGEFDANNFDQIGEVIQNLRIPKSASAQNKFIDSVYSGKRVVYEMTDPDLIEVFVGMNPAELGMYGKIMKAVGAQQIARALRAGATLSMEYMAKTPMRDVPQSMITHKFNPLDYATGVVSAFSKDEKFQEALRAGVFSSGMFDTDRDVRLAGNVINEWLGKTSGKDMLFKVLKSPIDALAFVSEGLERGTKLGAYQRRLKQNVASGMPNEKAIRDAVIHGRDSNVDFGMHGSRTTSMRLTTTFWNAAIQSYDLLYNSFKKDPVGFTKRGAALITVPTVINYLHNRQDPEYFKIPKWERSMFWHFKVNGEWNRFPKPFELGQVFGTSVERLLESIDQQDKSIVDGWAKDYIVNTATSLVPIPTMAKPILENAVNYDLLRNKQVTPPSLERLSPQYREHAGTSEWARQLSRQLNSVGVDISPINIDHVFSGWTGGLGREASALTDKGLDVKNVLEGEKTWESMKPSFDSRDLPLVKGFKSGYPRGSTDIDDLYELANKAREASADANYLEKSLRIDDLVDHMERNAVLIGLGPTLQPTLEALGQLRAERSRITRDESISPRDKRGLFDELDRQMADIAASVYEAVKQFDPSKQPPEQE